MTIKTKPIKWEENHDGTIDARASSGEPIYRVFLDGELCTWRVHRFLPGGGCDGHGYCTLDEAKEAAQQDWQEFIQNNITED